MATKGACGAVVVEHDHKGFMYGGGGGVGPQRVHVGRWWWSRATKGACRAAVKDNKGYM